jgi:CRP-like cAMP-binding protein
MATLPEKERRLIMREGAEVSQHSGELLYEVGGDLSAIYFPYTSVVSVTTELSDGRIVESVSIGREGLVGLPFLLGAKKSHHRVICQVPGEALKVPAASFAMIVARLPVFRVRLGLFTDATLTATSQSAACLAMHPVVERCARWLLMTADRTGSEQFHLTQEFLAAMLGSHRPTVTLAAGSLQQSGLIRYHRGEITVLDRKGLEAASCECYRAVTDAYEEILLL